MVHPGNPAVNRSVVTSLLGLSPKLQAPAGMTASTAAAMSVPRSALSSPAWLTSRELAALDQLGGLDGLILAVPHRVLGEPSWERLFAAVAPGGVFIDVKSAVARDRVPPHIHYWS